MRVLGSILFALLFFVLPSACKSSPCCDSCAQAQVVVTAVAGENPDCTRLTLHCSRSDGSAVACASTNAAKVGKASDPEDLRVMQSGKTEVLEEAGGLDVTVPIHAKDGKFQSACGVTLRSAAGSRDQLIEKATAMAKAVEARLGACCGDCCK